MNNSLLRITAVAALLAFSATTLSAQARRSAVVQPRLEDLPCFPIDTVDTPDPETRIILYSNNTWKYHRPALERFNSLEVFSQHWDTTQVFAYRSIELADLPPVVELKLISSLSEFNYPIKGKVFSKYGPRGRRNHNGVDIPLKIGDPIYATFSGRVRYARYNNGGFGNLIILRHENGLETWYAHLSRNNVAAGEYVKAGQIIGYGGSTGRSRGPHLHFEMRYCDQTFDPEFLVDFENGQLRYQTFALEKSFFNIRSRASDQLEEDDEFDLLAYNEAAGGDPDLTSEQILARITEAQNKANAKASTGATVSAGGNAVYHTIKSGDMLGKIAIKYGVSIDQICRLNGITRTTTLKIGRSIRVK